MSHGIFIRLDGGHASGVGISEAQDKDSVLFQEEHDKQCSVCAHLSEHDTEIIVSSLKTSADDGCPCCSTLIHIFEHFEEDGRRLIDIAADEACYTQAYPGKNDGNKLHRHAVELSIPALNIIVGLSVAPDKPNRYSLPVEHGTTPLAPRTTQGGRAEVIPVPLHASTSFKAHAISTSLPQIQTWLQTCFSDHEDCGLHPELFQPSRILFIGETEPAKIFLMASKTKIPYIALSYCWGKAQFLKLTTSNLQACKNGILINSLPNVFQHAIAIARGLGVYGIWIDALCIIQDDLGDWEIEASKMANVYQNSVLVLAMTSAANPDEDCLGGYFNVSIDNINARLIHHPPHTGWPTSNAFPLAKRGWTFQERLLAPRIVYFGPHELSWECQTYRNCECGRDSGFEPFINDFNTALRRSDPEEVAVLWRALIQQYTTLQFTFESDRLPALSGIVATIQLSRSGTYLAGLWSDTLILDMLWFVDEDEREKPNLSESRLVSPTWSWASIAVPVTYSTAKSSFYDLHIESQVAAFNCEPAGLSMSGRIKSGWVRLESSTLFCRQATSSGVSKFKVIMPGTEKEMGDFEASLIFDRQPNSPDFKFLMVRMASWRSIRYEHDEEQTLLIRPVSVEGNFERIGFAVRGVSHPRLPWPEERSIITIV